MRPHLDGLMFVLVCLMSACGGRSSLGDSGETNAAGGASHAATSGGTWATTGSSGGAKGAEGGFVAYTGGTHAAGGTSAGLGGTRATATMLVQTGGARATGGVSYGTGGARVTGGAFTTTGGTKTSGGSSFAQGGASASTGGTSAQGGLATSVGTSAVTGGMTATGGTTDTSTIAGGTAGATSTIGECSADQVSCGAGTTAKCVDTSKDPEHCGQCNHACAKGAACSYGDCDMPRCQPTFRMGGAPTVETERSAVGLAVGDLNGDGHLDFATANSDASTVSVLLGDGNGGFSPRIEYPAGNTPIAIAIGDFNRDGYQDLVTANTNANSVSVLLGRADGALESAVQYFVGDEPRGVAIDDFDGDGRADIATANMVGASVSILLGSGDGTFATRIDYPAGTNPDQIVTGDFNADGKKDLITNGGPAKASVLLGAGNGTFMSASPVPTDGDDGSVRLALGDLNSDGKQDLIVGRPGGRWSAGTFGVFFGVGDGSFLPMAPYQPGWARVVASADLDGDGKFEVVASIQNQSLSTISVNADGTLAVAVNYPTPAQPMQVVFGDFNGDNWPDIATLDLWGIYLLFATGNGKFDAPVSQPTDVPLRNVLLHDLDGDGRLDLAGVGGEYEAASSTVISQLGLGNGTFVGSNEYSIRYAERLIEAGDLNGDGHPDLVTAQRGGSGVNVLWNAGGASYATQTNFATATAAVLLELGDLDNNGKTDILVASLDSSLPVSTVTVLLNEGTGTFASNVYEYYEPLGTLALADLNHDDTLDLVQSDGEPDGLAVRLGLGDGRFGAKLQSATNGARISRYTAAIGDLNGDGHLDLVSLDTGTPYVDVMLGVGDGTFTPLTPQPVAGNYDLGRLVLADMNGDGILDLLSHGNVGWVGYEIVVLLGAGDGTFSCVTASLPAGADGDSSALGDINGDQRLDLVVPNAHGHSVVVLLNQSL